MSLYFYIKKEENDKEESINNYNYLFQKYEYKKPTLSEALYQMFKSSNLNEKFSQDFTEDILNKCHDKIDNDFDRIKQKYNNITKDDAYIISSYTLEANDKNYSPYRILNQNLVSENRENGVSNVSKYLYIFLSSLRKLPRYYPRWDNYLYRCIKQKVNIKNDPYNKKMVPYQNGNYKTFWAFTSTSFNPKTTVTFLKDERAAEICSSNKKEIQLKSGTIFRLKGDIWGYDISLFNKFNEEEILLEPERKFRVCEVLPEINEIIFVTCDILQTPLVLEKEVGRNTNMNYNKDNKHEKKESEFRYMRNSRPKEINYKYGRFTPFDNHPVNNNNTKNNDKPTKINNNIDSKNLFLYEKEEKEPNLSKSNLDNKSLKKNTKNICKKDKSSEYQKEKGFDLFRSAENLKPRFIINNFNMRNSNYINYDNNLDKGKKILDSGRKPSIVISKGGMKNSKNEEEFEEFRKSRDKLYFKDAEKISNKSMKDYTEFNNNKNKINKIIVNDDNKNNNFKISNKKDEEDEDEDEDKDEDEEYEEVEEEIEMMEEAEDEE